MGRNLFAVLVLSAAMLTTGSTIVTGRASVAATGERAVNAVNVKTPVIRKGQKVVKRERRNTDDDLNKLDARLALLWARVQELETKALAKAREGGKTNA